MNNIKTKLYKIAIKYQKLLQVAIITIYPPGIEPG